MASAASASPVTLFDTPSNGTRSARRKPDGPSRSPGVPLVIPIGRGIDANQQPAAIQEAGPSNQQQQQQSAVQQPLQQRQQEQQQQQQQQQRRQRRQLPPAAAGGDVIVIDSDDDPAAAADDDVIITGVTVGQKRHRQQPQQQQAGLLQQRRQQAQQLAKPGAPALPTWEQPAPPPQPPSPEPAFKCLICLEGIKADNMATTPCGHMFCFDCINDAVKVTKKCPKCRKNTTLKAIKRLYPN